MVSEFEEIGHAGGKITFRINTDENGRHFYQAQFSISRPAPRVITAVYALRPGVPVETIRLGGTG